MALNPQSRKAVNTIVPTLVAGLVVFMLYRAKQSWKVIVIAAAVAWVLVYVITNQITKAILVNGPAPVPTGGGCTGYDPTALGDALYENLNCWYCPANDTLYSPLLTIADCQLITLYNYFNQKYYTSTAKTLPVMIAGIGLDIQPQILQRFSTLGLQ